MDVTQPRVPRGAHQEKGRGICRHSPSALVLRNRAGTTTSAVICALQLGEPHEMQSPSTGLCTDGSALCLLASCALPQDQQPGTPGMEALRAWVQPAHQETLDAGDGVHVILVPAALNEGSQAGGIQRDLGIAAVVRLQPRML